MNKALALFLILLSALPLAQSNHNPQQESLVLTHVTLIDVSSGSPKPDMTIVITGDRITDIGESDKLSIPQGAKVVNGAGKFLIPGLWDMHVHWYNREYLPLFLANGVTGVRQMFGNSMHLEWRRDFEKGSLHGPRMIIASPIVDGPKPVWPDSIAVHNEAEGREAVRKVKKWGADFVKVYSLLPRDAYFGIAAEAKEQGIPFAGHVPFSISPAEASDAGQKSIEHLTGIVIACSDAESELRKEIVQAGSPVARVRAEAKAIETYDNKKAAALFEKFIKNGTWQCPTLTVLRSTAYLDNETFKDDPRLIYMPRQLKLRWNPRNNPRLASRTPEMYANAKRVLQKQLEIVGAMQRAGVPLLAGTDTGNPFCFPGFSLHDELMLLVRAGLTPAEALRAATLNPAKFLGLEESLGTIDKGKLADLVLLDASPLADIRNTQKIHAVVMNGRLFDRKALDKMLSQAEGN